MILAGEQRLPLEHLGKDTSCAPNIDFDVVLLPCKHDLWRSVVPSRYVAGHLGVLNTGETKVADLEVAVLVDEDVGGFEVAVHNTCRVDIFEATLLVLASAAVRRERGSRLTRIW